jgi:hypothetical protein
MLFLNVGELVSCRVADQGGTSRFEKSWQSVSERRSVGEEAAERKRVCETVRRNTIRVDCGVATDGKGAVVGGARTLRVGPISCHYSSVSGHSPNSRPRFADACRPLRTSFSQRGLDAERPVFSRGEL